MELNAGFAKASFIERQENEQVCSGHEGVKPQPFFWKCGRLESIKELVLTKE